MLISKSKDYTLIKMDENSITEFYKSYITKRESLANEHVILHFSESFNTSLQEIELFLNIANEYSNNGTSFVIICSGVEIDKIPDEINVVPTLTEAVDVLELDAIERDLMNF